MELIIGRESSTAMSIGQRLHVVTSQKKEFFIGNEGSVPNTVSRQHCKLTVDDSGDMTLTNIKPTNITYVNGQEIYQKTISKGDRIELGSDRFALDLQTLLDSIELPQTYDISHLKAIWEEYDKTKTGLQIAAQKNAAVQSVTGIFSMASMVCGIIPVFPGAVRAVLVIIALGLGVIFFIYRLRHAGENLLQLKSLEEDFHKKYVCPNPNCQRFLGNAPYEDLIKQTKGCFVCKANYKV